MRNVCLILLVTSLVVIDVAAQTGTCSPGTAKATLESGDARARIFNTGAHFFNGERDDIYYEVPKGSGINAAFVLSANFIGKVAGELRGSAARFGPWEFWPGPLDTSGNPPDNCVVYDRIWEITREDVDNYESTGEISQNLSEWPWTLGAPVIDGDGNLNNYSLSEGDRPELLGDQRLWWIMNDRGNAHEHTGSEPLGLEVRASAFGFQEIFPSSTFYRYEFIYKGSTPLTRAHAGFYMDGDLGDPGDDYAGTDTLLNMGYFYNATNEDEQYGVAPPAIGLLLVNTPEAPVDLRDNDNDLIIDEDGEQLGITGLGCASVWGFQDCDLCDIPDLLTHHYNCMRGLSGFGNTVGEGAAQYPPGTTEFMLDQPPTAFYFPGDPVTGRFWSAVNAFLPNGAATSSDRSFSMSTGPLSMENGESAVIDLAVVWGRGRDNLESIIEMRKNAILIRKSAAEIFPQNQPATSVNTEKPSQFRLYFDQNYPNPFSAKTTFRYGLAEAQYIRLEIFDVLGRKISSLVNAPQSAGEYTLIYDGRDLPTGIYIARMQAGESQLTRQVIVMR